MELLNIYNIYCDESSVENADSKNMVIGAVLIPRNKKKELVDALKKIYEKHSFNKELKWSKLNKRYLDFYRDIINYFSKEEYFKYRCIVIDKSKIDIEKYHDGDWELAFFKFYYLMLRKYLSSNGKYYIFLDKKPTMEKYREKGLFYYLCLYAVKYRNNCKIKHLQSYDSKENLLIQLADFFTGLVGFDNNIKVESKSFKLDIVKIFKDNANIESLKDSSLLAEEKFNIFIWKPNDRNKNNNI